MTRERMLDDFPLRSQDKLRYGDTDRQGHINNAVFATFFETGRVELVYEALQPALEPGHAFVIARIEIDFLGEVLWPGTVDIGTAVSRLGRSSIGLEQALYQNGQCAARAVGIVVLTDTATRRSTPLTAAMRERLQSYLVDPRPAGA
jgi:acyl-CoA thioester hydrolase